MGARTEQPARGREWAVRTARVIDGPVDLSFGLLSDTARWNHMLGGGPLDIDFRPSDPADPTSRTRYGSGRFGLSQLRFFEEGEYWSGRYLRAWRQFVDCATARWFARAFYNVDVTPVEAGTDGHERSRVEMHVGFEIVGLIGWLMAPLVLLLMKINTLRLLRGVAADVHRPGRPTAAGDEPPAMVALRASLRRDRRTALAGDHFGKVHSEALRTRVAELAARPVPDDLAHRMVTHLIEQPESNLRQIRPFQLAEVWGLDRREVLRGFLHATSAGVFDLIWQVNCPTCRVGAGSARSLADLDARMHCGECDISYDVGFADNVEATFTPNAAIRAVDQAIYCGSSPYFLQHIHGYVTVPPGQTRTVGPLPPGDLLVRTRGAPRQITLSTEERPAGALALRITGSAVERVDDGGAEPGTLVLRNDDRVPVRVLVERAGWDADIARGSLLVTMPEFYRLFGTEAPATGISMSVGAFAIAFTDVVGSTEMYQRLGDARAFALVQEHWRHCRDIVARHGGAVVKTMGDGLMCCFPATPAALDAMLEINDQTEAMSGREEVDFAIRAGIHEGPCYAVRVDDRLDLFGNTVNLAARIMATADGGEVALAAADARRPALAFRLGDDELHVRDAVTSLRGVREPVELRFVSRVDARVFDTGSHAPVAGN